MSRLPRPPIPLAVKLTVALRQLSECHPSAIKLHVDAMRQKRRLGVRLIQAMESLARKLGCEVRDLRLDHDPALENREKLVEMPDGNRLLTIIVPKGARVLRYTPDANDPAFLFYRPHGAQFAGSHLIKTNIRGDRGQHSDRALAAKNKRIVRNREKPGKTATKSRQLRSANRWPPKGSQKIQNRRNR